MIPRFDQIYTFTSPQRVPVIQRTSSDLNPTDLEVLQQTEIPVIIVSNDDSGQGVEVHIPDTPPSGNSDLKALVQKELEILDCAPNCAIDTVLKTLNIDSQQSKDSDLTSRGPFYFPGGFVLPRPAVSCRCQQSLARGGGEPVLGERDSEV